MFGRDSNETIEFRFKRFERGVVRHAVVLHEGRGAGNSEGAAQVGSGIRVITNPPIAARPLITEG